MGMLSVKDEPVIEERGAGWLGDGVVVMVLVQARTRLTW